ncbi:MAG: short-chain dehydrogenase/reductase [Gemmatimonadetes bacterium]|nr:short-chain dehydrogenase/reductase [Gemmatimonadota bacterium]
MELAGRNVVLTGVGHEGQVGEAVARAFAERGARVFLVDRQESEARARAEALVSAGLRAAGLGADLSDVVLVDALAAQIRDATRGRVHALVHLAGGFASSGPVAESDPAVWSHQFDINVGTAYLTTRAFLPMLRPTKGAIVLFASEAALPGARVAGIAAYAAAKTAVLTLMQAIAQEERDAGVRANALAPASIRTAKNLAEMGPDAAYVTREAVAEVAVWLCSDGARAVTGQVVRVR